MEETGAVESNNSSESEPSSCSSSPPPKRVAIKYVEMSDDMLKQAADIAVTAFEKCSVHADVAQYIKKKFDEIHGPSWHCIVGTDFGSYVSHEMKKLAYFTVEETYVLLFRNKVKDDLINGDRKHANNDE